MKQDMIDQPGILGEEWKLIGDTIWNGIFKVEPNYWLQEIAALPDALRALKAIRTVIPGEEPMSLAECQKYINMVDNVLKKAGII